MAFLLNSTTIANPNQYSEGYQVIGDMVTTMGGGRRRAIHAKKRVWKLAWSLLAQTDFTTIKNLYDLNTTVVLTNTALTPALSATVHLDMDERSYTPGSGTKYISGVTLTCTEV